MSNINVQQSYFIIPHQNKFVGDMIWALSVRLRFVCQDEYLPTPMNILFRFFKHAFITILPWILWRLVWFKFKMADLSPFLFAQNDKIFENFVLPDIYLQYQWIFFSDTLHIYLFITILPWILWSFVRIIFKMAD